MAEPGQFALTPSVQDIITTAISNGLYLEDALRAAGLNVRTYYDWMQKAEEDPDRPHAAQYRAFAEAVKAAEARYQAHYLGSVRAAAENPKTWTAAAWLLERRFPQKWGLRNRTELTGPDGAPVKIVFEFVRPKADEDDQAEDS